MFSTKNFTFFPYSVILEGGNKFFRMQHPDTYLSEESTCAYLDREYI